MENDIVRNQIIEAAPPIPGGRKVASVSEAALITVGAAAAGEEVDSSIA